jgi:hypothetical protein
MAREKLRAEDEGEALATEDALAMTADLLAERGYEPGEILKDQEYTVTAGGFTETVRADYIVRVGGRSYMAVKCSMAVDSRERHITAFSRVVEPGIIPLAVVTDGIVAHVVDALTGRLLNETLEGIPTREEAVIHLGNMEPVALAPEKRERETRVLLAFETASCPRVPDGKKGTGGSQ